MRRATNCAKRNMHSAKIWLRFSKMKSGRKLNLVTAQGSIIDMDVAERNGARAMSIKERIRVHVEIEAENKRKLNERKEGKAA